MRSPAATSAAPAPGASAPARQALPSGVRLVLNFAEAAATPAAVTRDTVLGPAAMTSRSPPRKRGAALLTAMVIVTPRRHARRGDGLAAMARGAVEAAERARLQSAWILAGALDWARLILREDARSGGADHLGEPWAVPLAEARLSTFLAADKDNTDDAPDAFLSGAITDAQARYNLRNLVDAATGKVAPAELDGVEAPVRQRSASSTDVADAAGQRAGAPPAPGSGDASLMPQSVAQLAWLGLDADTVRRLAPYVVLLPVRTPVNLNTASREVIAASDRRPGARRRRAPGAGPPAHPVQEPRRGPQASAGGGRPQRGARSRSAPASSRCAGGSAWTIACCEERSLVERRNARGRDLQRERV